MQLQAAKQRIENQGLKLAAISYDSPEILKDFSSRRKIEFPLLADPDSKIIRSFGVLAQHAPGFTKGMAFAGFFFIDESGVIREKYFEDRFSDRFTPNNVILKLFPQLAEQTVSSVNAPHLRISLAQSDLTAVPGSRITLLVEAELPPEVHVYSPGVKGYKPISLSLQPAPDFHAGPTSYPASKMLHLEAINETVPVFEGKFRIAQDVTFASSDELIHSLAPSGKAIDIVGELKYQACDKKVCYLPMSIPLTWRVQLTPLDAQRSPAAIQHK